MKILEMIHDWLDHLRVTVLYLNLFEFPFKPTNNYLFAQKQWCDNIIPRFTKITKITFDPARTKSADLKCSLSNRIT